MSNKKMLKLKKRREVQKAYQYKDDYPVAIGIPVPMIDKRMMAGLACFISGASARNIALPMTVDSRNSENGRNQIIKDFLAMEEYKNKTHLMFIDADTVPDNPYSIEKMLLLDKPVVTGITPIGFKRGKEYGMYWNVRANKEKCNLFLDEMPNLPFVADYVGGSCMLIRRDVLEKLEPPYQMSTYDKDQISFEIGEDYYFCDKIRNAGFELWADPEIQCHHYHTLDMLEIILMIARYAQSMTSEGVINGYENRIKELLEELKQLREAG